MILKSIHKFIGRTNLYRRYCYYKQKRIYKDLVFDKTCNIHSTSQFEGANKLGYNVIMKGFLGYGTYIGANSVIYGSIGRFTSIGPFTSINLGLHPLKTNFVTLSPMFYSTAKQCGKTFSTEQLFKEINDEIIIGNDCWIGERCFFTGGITIGDGAVVLSCAAVVKDVPPFAIVGGVPAKILGYRYDQDTIAFLQKIQWWNKDIDWIREHWKLMTNIESLKKYFSDID
jgi:UDP-3-O-[3-hydroxymyristoyl] glucosamine N-acyltransferase